MIGTHKALTLAATAAVALSVTAVAASGAQAAKKRTKASAAAPTTITICVKTKTGTIKVLSAKQVKQKKKCGKGYKKLTWNVKGASGKNGTNGTGTNGTSGTNGTNGLNGGSLKVRDSAGNLIGSFAGVTSSGLLNAYSVLGTDGGLYNYLPSGQVMPTPGFASATFKDSACTGPAFLVSTEPPSDTILALLGGPVRIVLRSTDEDAFTYGPARAWKVTTTVSFVPASPPTFYVLLEDGSCVAAPGQPSPGDFLVALASVPTPPDGVGSLTIG